MMGSAFAEARDALEQAATEALAHWQRDYTRRILEESRRLYLAQQHSIGKLELYRGKLYRRNRARLLQQVEEAGVAAMLLQPEEILRIYDALPPLLQLITKHHRPRDIEGMLRLLTYNLDWYLNPGPVLFRKGWLITIGTITLSFAGLLLALVLDVIIASRFPFGFHVLIGLMALMVIYIAYARLWPAVRNILLSSPRSALHADVLHDYFNCQLADVEPVSRDDLTAILVRHKLEKRRQSDGLNTRMGEVRHV